MTVTQFHVIPMRSLIFERQKFGLVTLAIFSMALVIRLKGLGSTPYWMDEITTIQRASLPLATLISDSLTFHHVPSYFVLLSWIVPFGTDEILLPLSCY